MTLLNVANFRPLEALELLNRNLPADSEARARWRDTARVSAVMGSCPRSIACFKSGLKHWLRFIEVIHGEVNIEEAAFPPGLSDVLAWSNTFRS